jgi:hypothetical protein
MKTVSVQICTESNFTEWQDLTFEKKSTDARWFICGARTRPIARDRDEPEVTLVLLR